MRVVSSRDFASNNDRYFDLALNEQVFVHRGDKMFVVTSANTQNAVTDGYMPSEEFRKRAFEKVNKFCDTHGIL